MDLERLDQIAQESMAHRKTDEFREPGFVFYHGRRTAQIALGLADQIGAMVRRDVLYAGALFHDIGKGTEPHNAIGARMARDLLSGICQPEEVKGICEIILQHAQRERANECALETRIVQDADLLDHVGPIGLWLAFYWIATHGETADDLLRYLHSEESSRRLTWMRNALNFGISADIFDQRVEYDRQFFAEFGRVHREGLCTGDTTRECSPWTMARSGRGSIGRGPVCPVTREGCG